MLKIKKLTAVVLSALVIISACVIGGVMVSNNQNEDFRASLTSIYSKYDKDFVKTSLENDEFAMKRLIVADYDGKKYGAVDSAVDKKNSFAVLQYKTSADARKAYDKMRADGYVVDPDGFAELDSYDVGEMCPIASQTMGTAEYVKNFRMSRDEVLVAVIDTGVMLDHPDLAGRFYNNGYDYSSDGFDNAYYDTACETSYYLHSTFISGIIANNTPDNVKIVPYKVVPFGGDDGEISAILASLNSAIDMGVDVVNISIGTYSSRDVYHRLVNKAVEQGICICASSGNNGKPVNSCPASFSEVITVGALNRTCDNIASFSNYGPAIDFVAPGSHIISTIPTENGAGYGEYSGTSFSTPYIVSACANIKSMNKELTKEQVYNILCDFSVDFGDEGRDDYYGNGVPDLSDMVYTDNESYSYSLPQGELSVYATRNYGALTQPWRLFADKIISVSLDPELSEIGDYNFYNMNKAEFSPAELSLTSVGNYAFYGCKKLNNITFGIDVESVGRGAFGNIRSNYTITGYSNTPAEIYALDEDINFVSVGCKHNYAIEIVEPEEGIEGYTIYTCLVCGNEYTGAYIQPEVVASGVCGENAEYYLYNTGRLEITGSGEMYSYISEPSPFEGIKDEITKVYITGEIASVSPFAFSPCRFIKSFHSLTDSISITSSGIYSADGKRLIYAFGDDYVMPEAVEAFDASAFLSSDINVNDNFVVENNLVYDSDGNIVMACPEYNESVLTIENDISIYDNAFLLTDFPFSLRCYSYNLGLGNHSIGYSYNNGLYKNDFVFYGYDNTNAYAYVLENGFTASPLNGGYCGDNLTWHYDLDTCELRISGSGGMYKYSSKDSVPWYDYMSRIRSIVVDDEVTSLSIYSFFSANAVRSITVPLSLSVVNSQTVWLGCVNVNEVVLTQGTGIMPDYGTAQSSSEYTYSPWYQSKNKIQSFTISENVEYIGRYAFRSCMGIKSLTLNNCSEIGAGAFSSARFLTSVTNLNKETIFGKNCFSNAPVTFYGYSDSTTKDFAETNGFDFVSIGCDHSRGLVQEYDHPVCCFNSDVDYYCADCGAYLYREFCISERTGHFIKASVSTCRGTLLEGAEVYVDRVLSAVTNEHGRFVVDGVRCGEKHLVEIKKHGLTVASTFVETNEHNRSGVLNIHYGDFVRDNVVNAKDYAYALKHNFDDIALLDYGKIPVGEGLDISTEYSVQSAPAILSIYNEPNESVSYRRNFCAQINVGKDYMVKEAGFIFGKNMEDEFMSLENIGEYNDDGFQLKKNSTTELVYSFFKFPYGSSSGDGKISARFFIIYTNGVKDYVVYSKVTSYTYK